jgi:hypothetical protein
MSVCAMPSSDSVASVDLAREAVIDRPIFAEPGDVWGDEDGFGDEGEVVCPGEGAGEGLALQPARRPVMSSIVIKSFDVVFIAFRLL